jgi:hypothetical protein
MCGMFFSVAHECLQALEKHGAPDGRRVDHRRAALDGAQHARGNGVGIAREGRPGGLSVMPVRTKPGFTQTVRSPCARKRWSRPSRSCERPALAAP